MVVTLPSNLPNVDPPAIFNIDLLQPLKNFLNWLVSQIVNLGKTIASFLQENVIKPIVDAFNWVITKIKEGIENTVKSILNFLKGSASPVTPDRAFSVMIPLITLGTIGVLTLGVLLTALSIKIVDTGFDMKPISDFLRSIINPSMLIGMTLGTILGIFFRVPLGYWAKKFFRPYKPDPITLFGLYTRGYISRSTLREELAYVTGFTDTYIDGLIEIFEYNPSLFDLLRMADFVELSDDFITRSLKILGIREPYFSVIATLIKRRPIREEVRANVNFMVYLYQNGFISKDFLTTALSGLALQTKEKELILMLADNKRTYELIERKIKILRTSFVKGFINEATLVSELEKLKLDREFINIIVSDAKLYRKVEVPVPKVTRAFGIELPITTSYSYSIS